MKQVYILILSALLTAGCGSDSSETNSTTNLNRPARTPLANREENTQIDKEKEARVVQKINEFVSINYPGWTLKGTENPGKSPLDLHIVKGAEEKVIKVNYKKFNDSNGQTYIVVSKIAQNDLSEENHDNNQNKPTTGEIEQRTERNTSSNN